MRLVFDYVNRGIQKQLSSVEKYNCNNTRQSSFVCNGIWQVVCIGSNIWFVAHSQGWFSVVCFLLSLNIRLLSDLEWFSHCHLEVLNGTCKFTTTNLPLYLWLLPCFRESYLCALQSYRTHINLYWLAHCQLFERISFRSTRSSTNLLPQQTLFFQQSSSTTDL